MVLRRLLTPVYNITMIILTNRGTAIFEKIKTDNTEFWIEYGDHDYRITRKGLYKKPAFIYLELLKMISRTHDYWIIFHEGSSYPLAPGEPKITPEELYLVNKSRTLSRGYNELVERSIMNYRFVLFVLAILILIGYYLVSQGYVIL